MTILKITGEKPLFFDPMTFFREKMYRIPTLFFVIIGLFFSLPTSSLAKDLLSKVVIVESSDAVRSFVPNSEKIREMVDIGIKEITGKETVLNGILSLISTNDIVGIKVYTLHSETGGTRPEVVRAVVDVLKEAGLPLDHIILWDRSMDTLRSSGFLKLSKELKVGIAASTVEGFDKEVSYNSFFPSSLVAGDVEFSNKNNFDITTIAPVDSDVGRRSFLTKLLTERITKIIMITPLLHHNLLGTTGHIYSLASGSTDNFLRFEMDGDRLAEAVSEIYAMEEVGDRVVLCITDALLCQYRGQSNGFLHYSKPLNELRFSFDPVALDWMSLKTMLDIQNSVDGMNQSLSVFSPSGKTLCENAILLELGNGNESKLQVQRIDIGKGLDSIKEPTLPKDITKKKSWWKFWKSR